MSLINPAYLAMSSVQLGLLTPYLVLFFGACLALVLVVTPSARPDISVPGVMVASMAAALVGSACQVGAPAQALFNGMLLSDGFSAFANILFLGSGIAVTLMSFRYLKTQDLVFNEYYVLIGLSILGMMLMASTLNLVVIFIALELMSFSVYCLVGFRRADRRSNEAAIKYYILGSAASAILLYGAAMLYGSSLTLDIGQIADRAAQSGALFSPLLVIGLLCVLIGFLFKTAAVPFHAWMPDVYDGAPIPITAFMTTGLKAAVFLALVRVMASVSSAPLLTGSVATSFHHILWMAALLTMLVGNLVALQQTNLKRMLAYSSIAHTGYLLVGLMAGSATIDGYTAVYFYVMVYAIMNLGAFGVLTLLALKGDAGLELGDLAGLAQRRPWLSFALAVFMFSMAGLPPTAGFTAKYFLFYSAVQSGDVLLVVLAVLCSAIGAYYYLRVIVQMYMKEPVGQAAGTTRFSYSAALTLGVTVALVFQLGLFPSAAMKTISDFMKGPQPTTALVK